MNITVIRNPEGEYLLSADDPNTRERFEVKANDTLTMLAMTTTVREKQIILDTIAALDRFTKAILGTEAGIGPAPVSTKARAMPVCSECGSDDIKFDAWSEYDTDAQDYSLVTTMDDAHCDNCDGECSIEWVDPDVYVVPEYDTEAQACPLCDGVVDVEDHRPGCPSATAERLLSEAI